MTKMKRSRYEEEFRKELLQIGVKESEMEEVIEIHTDFPKLSAYECRRKHTVQKNEEQLKSLGIGKIARELKVYKKPKSFYVPKTKRIKIEKSEEPARKSPRLSGKEPIEYNKENITSLIPSEAERTFIPRKIPPKIEIKNTFEITSDEATPVLDTMKTDVKLKKMSSAADDLKDVTLKMSGIVKVCRARITAMSVFEGDSLLIASGSKWGDVGLCRYDEEPLVVTYQPHNDVVGCLRFQGNKLYSCSYDGSVKMFDPEKIESSLVYSNEDVWARYFDFQSANNILVTNVMGEAHQIDQRTGSSVGQFPKHGNTKKYGSLWCIDVNKFDPNYFVTSSNNGAVRLWDVRQNKNNIDVYEHSKTVNSAYFDTLNGQTILTTSVDDKLGVLSFTEKCKFTELRKINHDNYTGRWITKFRAMWLPNSNNYFTIGSMRKYPRCIEVYNVYGQKQLELCNVEYMVSIQSFGIMHQPTGSLIGGNASGYNYIFTKNL